MSVRRKPITSKPKGNRVAKRGVPDLQSPDVLSNPGRRNRVPRKAPAGKTGGAQAGAGQAGALVGLVDLTDANHAGTVSGEALAALAAASAPPAGEPAGPAAAPAGAPPAGQPDTAAQIAEVTADCGELIEYAWGLVKASEMSLPRRTGAALDKTETRKGIAAATGRLLHHYGLTLGDIATNPWVGLALALSPVVVAGAMDFRDFREAQLKAQATQSPPPVVATNAASSVVSTGAPPTGLHTRA
jgi:hypothetical protein